MKVSALAALSFALIGLAQIGHTVDRVHPVPKTKPVVSTEIRRAAKKLAYSLVESASTQTLDWLAYREIAFAGMVPGVTVVLDGQKMDAGKALMDSGLTIIQSSEHDADARAIRNTVYILMEIAEGTAARSRGK